MKYGFFRSLFGQLGCVAAAGLILAAPVCANIIISEVHPTGSSNSTYQADWIELTNLGAADVDITGWRIDDSSNEFGSALPFRNLTSIPPGKSAIFFEGNTAGTNFDTIKTNFINAWFGGSAPAEFLVGDYGGSGIGLSSSGDQVNIFNSLGERITGVSFGSSTNAVTFDNASGIGGIATPPAVPPAISLLSAVGVNGAFNSVTGGEVGSPGAAVPEPAGIALALVSLGLIGACRRTRGAANH